MRIDLGLQSDHLGVFQELHSGIQFLTQLRVALHMADDPVNNIPNFLLVLHGILWLVGIFQKVTDVLKRSVLTDAVCTAEDNNDDRCNGDNGQKSASKL